MVALRHPYNDIRELEVMRPPRRDALPEHTSYADTGCDLHPSCLTCPLARCRYDEPGGARRLLAEGRDIEVVALQRQGGVTIDTIARRVGVSRRTVFRILARAREGRARA
jgi:hypothetical protein